MAQLLARMCRDWKAVDGVEKAQDAVEESFADRLSALRVEVEQKKKKHAEESHTKDFFHKNGNSKDFKNYLNSQEK
eukprot:3034763-Amphidinium_carterae.1